VRYTPIDWDAPLDVARYVAAVPPDAVLKGFFPAAVAAAVRRRGRTLVHARHRYIPFRDYPMRDHVRLLHEAARALFPRTSPRRALRKIGWNTMRSLDTSLAGRVYRELMLTDLEQTLGQLDTVYGRLLPPARAEVTRPEPREAIVHFRSVYAFVDSHHVGIVERMFRAHDLAPQITLRRLGIADADLRCRW